MGEKSTEEKQITITTESYKGLSPSWMAYSSAAAYTVFALPIMWVANGLTNIGFDRLFNKIPFKQDVWSRFKRLDWVTGGIIVGTVVYEAVCDAKKTHKGAELVKRHINKQRIEHDLYREQLVEAGIKPKDVKVVREVDIRTLKLEDKPAASHADKITAEKAAAVEATPTP